MSDIDYDRQNARSDAITVRNNGNTWDSLVPNPDDPTKLWLRIPDTSEGVLKLMVYDWSSDTWSEFVPE